MVHAGYAPLPFFSLALGLIGAAAVATVSSLMAMHDVFRPLRYCGRNSIVIYLAFFLPMAATRTILLKTGLIPDVGTMSVIITAAGVVGSLAHVLGGARNLGVPSCSSARPCSGSRRSRRRSQAGAAAGGISPQARTAGLIMRG